MRIFIYQAGNHMELLPSIVHALRSAQPHADIAVCAADDRYAITGYLELLQPGCRVLPSIPLDETFDLTVIDPLLPANRFSDPSTARARLTAVMQGVRSRNILFGLHILSQKYLLSEAEMAAANRGVLLFGDHLSPPDNVRSFIIYPAYFGCATRDPCLSTLSSVAGFRRGCRDYAGTASELCELAARRGFTVHMVGKRAQDDLYPEIARAVAISGECRVRLRPDLCWPKLHQLLAGSGFLVSLPAITSMYSSRLSITGIINLAVGYRIPLLLEQPIAEVALDRWLSGSYRARFHYRDRRDMLGKLNGLVAVSPDAYNGYTSELSAIYDEWMGHNESTAGDILAWSH